MKNIVTMRMEGDTLIIRTRVYVDVRSGDDETAKRLICDGIARIGEQSPYMVGERLIYVSSEAELVERFSLDAVNVRVENVRLRRKNGLMRIFNTVSRAYMGARRIGILKLSRRLMRFPDVFINLQERDIAIHQQYMLQVSVVAHEFAHVWGCADQYKYRNDEKRSPRVAENDLMFRTGSLQRMQPYHIKRFCECAKKGKLPLRRIV